MPDLESPPALRATGPRFCFRGRRPGFQWAVLLVLSVSFVSVLEVLQLPAALLLGSMLAAIVIAAAEGTVRVPTWAFYAAQGVIGCMIARIITPPTLIAILQNLPLFLTMVLAVIVAGSALGGLLARWRALPGSTAIWGAFPGGASAMTLMAEAYGADIRLVAFMQYLRVVFVAILASVIARIWGAPSAGHVAAISGNLWFAPLDWPPFLATLALAGAGALLGRLLRIPAGSLLLPLGAGVVLNGTGVMRIDLPQWLLAASYALIGWSIGLRFTRPILRHAAAAFPRIALSILALIAICGGFAVVLVRGFGIDPLTAYLATSPGGADSVAIIAASTKVDMPFVMALQTARFVIILLAGPSIARLVTAWIGARSRQP